LTAVDLEITRTGSVERRAECSLVLFDKEGNVLWQAP
jgi:L-asparaginase II